MATEIEVLTIKDKAYPPLLKEIADPPKQLYIRGSVEALSYPHLLAVVGSRKANTYGKQCVNTLLPPLVTSGLRFVSGLAYGIDSLAHQACVELKQATVAVLGSGIDDDSIYPWVNRKLAHDILKNNGVIISEYEPGTPAHKGHFPARNRIIAGLCKATLIIQASINSGSLITGRLALDYNRDVLCVPGPITDPLSVGTNSFIQQGAAPTTEAYDILHIYDITDNSIGKNIAPEVLPKEQRQLLDVLSHKPQHIDEVVAKVASSAHDVSSSLTELEMLGAIEHVGGMKYVRKT